MDTRAVSLCGMHSAPVLLPLMHYTHTHTHTFYNISLDFNQSFLLGSERSAQFQGDLFYAEKILQQTQENHTHRISLRHTVLFPDVSFFAYLSHSQITN